MYIYIYIHVYVHSYTYIHTCYSICIRYKIIHNPTVDAGSCELVSLPGCDSLFGGPVQLY